MKLKLLAAFSLIAALVFAADVRDPSPVGVPVTIKAEADGTQPITFNWFKNGVKLANDSDTLTIASPTEADSGDYTVVATNEWGSAASDKYTFVFGVPPTTPVIKKVVISQTIQKQSTSLMYVDLDNGKNVKYQWYRNGMPIYGATDAQFVQTRVNPSYRGTYSVTMTDPTTGWTETQSGYLTVR